MNPRQALWSVPRPCASGRQAGQRVAAAFGAGIAGQAGEAQSRFGALLAGVHSAGTEIEGVGTNVGKVATGLGRLSKAADGAGGVIGGKLGRAVSGFGGWLDKGSARLQPVSQWLVNVGLGARQTAEGVDGLRQSFAGALGAVKGAAKAGAGFALAPLKLAFAPVKAGANLFGGMIGAGKSAAGAVLGGFRSAFAGLEALGKNNAVLRALHGIEAKAKQSGAAVRTVGLGLAGGGIAGYLALDQLDDAAKGLGSSLLLLKCKR